MEVQVLSFALFLRRLVPGMLPGLLATACAAPHPARSPGWEPTSPSIPAVKEHSAAAQYLQQSKELLIRWQQRNAVVSAGDVSTPWLPGRYSYIRGYEHDEGRVDFTLIAVNQGLVVVRALLSGDPRRFGDGEPRQGYVNPFRALWVERGKEVGDHDDGAPPLTVEALYEECEREILGADTDASPRLYFHRNGLLMHCGYVASECPDCESVSLQSLTIFPIDEIFPSLDPSRWVCETPHGPVLPWSDYPVRAQGACVPPVLPRSHAGGYSCRNDEAQALGVPADYGIGSSLCGCDGHCLSAHWGSPWPTPCPGSRSWPLRKATFFDLGKPTPRARWSFPFGFHRDGVCG